jgi:hypothetical protein
MRRSLVLFAVAACACGTYSNPPPEQTERLHVTVRLPNGVPLPTASDPPLALPTDAVAIEFDVQALDKDGAPAPDFAGFVRISAVPGSVVEVQGDRAQGRNVLLLDGIAENQTAQVRSARGPTRLWAEDIGYVPEDPGLPPRCADGQDNDGDGLVDYPNDPGCAFANDNSETGGTYAAGVSDPVRFALPRIADVQGLGAVTPYPLEQVTIQTAQPANLIVSRISKDGFYFSDTTETRGYGHGFAYTFNTPPGVRVCDRVSALAATATEFFGFTELNSPSFAVHAWHFPTQTDYGDGPCQLPEPAEIPPDSSDDDVLLEQLESGLVRVRDLTVGAFFGALPAAGKFTADSSNCDINGNGVIDFTDGAESACANACAAEPECVEWTGYASRGNWRAVLPSGKTIQVNTGTVTGFSPRDMRGKPIQSVTGTLRNFSGGSLNWTIETRCGDDLVCDDPSQDACVNGPKDVVSSQIACVEPRTTYDPNEASN